MIKTAPMIAVASFLLGAPALAIVGGGVPSEEGIGRAVVTIVGSRGNFCTGSLIAPKLVLTVAHCVQPGAVYKIVENGATGSRNCGTCRPSLSIRVRHAGDAGASRHRRRGAAAARGAARREEFRRSSACPPSRSAGGRFTIAGVGVTIRGQGSSGGVVRAAGLVATGRPGTLQIRLVDPLTQGLRDGLGACTGDSGGPVFEDRPGGPVLVGVVSWSTGSNGSAGCGGLTGVTPLTLYRDWILQTARQWGFAL